MTSKPTHFLHVVDICIYQCVLIVQAFRVSVLTRSTLFGLDHYLNCFQFFFARVYLLDSFLRVMIFSNDHNYLSCGTLIFGRLVVISCAQSSCD
jgi:hypothetical protein